MTVLVTGAAGFLGSHVTARLVTRGARPRALVHPGDDATWLAQTGVDVRAADIGRCDRAALAPALAGIEYVVHCAARTGPWGPAPEYHRTNVRGLETLVRAAMAAGVRRFVHVSSITVHGNNVRGAADENSPLRTEPNPYSRSKVAGEMLLHRMIRDDGAPVTIVRPGWIYGPRDTASFARIARMIDQGRMFVIGSGENHLPLIYVSDVAEGVLLACEAAPAASAGQAAQAAEAAQGAQAAQAEGRAYLLVNDEPVTQRDFVTAIAAELGVPAPTRRIPYGPAMVLAGLSEHLGRLARRRPPVMRHGLQLLGGDNRFAITRARRELGFSPRVGLADGVASSVAWYRDSRPVRVPA